jgi:hypothetical protein
MALRLINLLIFRLQFIGWIFRLQLIGWSRSSLLPAWLAHEGNLAGLVPIIFDFSKK